MSSSKQDQPERSGKKPTPPGFPPQPPSSPAGAGGPAAPGDVWGEPPPHSAPRPAALPYMPDAGPLDGPPSSLRPPPDSIYVPTVDQLWKDSLPPQGMPAPPPPAPRPQAVAPPDFLLPPASQPPAAPPSEAIRGAGVGDLWTESLPPQRSGDPRAGWQASPAPAYPKAPSNPAPPPSWDAPPAPNYAPPANDAPWAGDASSGGHQPWNHGVAPNTTAPGYQRGSSHPSAGPAVDSGLQMQGGGTTLGDTHSMRPTYASGGHSGARASDPQGQGTVPTGSGPTIYGSGAPSPRGSSAGVTGSTGTHGTVPTGQGPTVYGSGLNPSSINTGGERQAPPPASDDSWRMFKESSPPTAGGSSAPSASSPFGAGAPVPPSPGAASSPADGWAALADSFPQRNKDSHVLRGTRPVGQAAPQPQPQPTGGLFSSNPPAGIGPEASTVLQEGSVKRAPQPQAPQPAPAGGYDIDDLLRQSYGENPPEGGAPLFQSGAPAPAAPAPGANPVFDSQPPAQFRAARPIHLDEVIARPMRLEQIEGNVAIRDEKLEARNKLWDESLPPSASAANKALSNESNTTSSINRQLLSGEQKISESRLRLAEQVERIWADSSLDQYHIGQTISRRGAQGKTAIGENLKMRSIVEPRKDQAAPQTADYESIGVLGEGGMGKVFLGRQAGLGRELAIKMLRSDFANDDEIKARFLAEAVATAALEHPGVVPVHELGRTQNRDIFYSMKRVKGYPWCDKLGEKTLRENLEILLRVCDAIAYAHSEFVIHRDLKPENVMLGDYGEVYVMDWGLSVSVDSRGKAFRAEDRENQAGSPSYMAPEMACGWESKLTEASDVYLLGAMLFEILTHNPPHTGSNVKQCLINAAANEIVPFDKEKLPPGSWELMQIALKAMASEQEDRYPTVKEFQGAIREFESHHDSIDLASRALEYHRKAQTNQGYDDFAQALFGYRAALDKWAHNDEAQAGIKAAAKEYAETALAKGDYDLAESLLPELREDAELASRIQRQKQLRVSGERTRRMLWSGLVLAAVVIMAGLTVGLGLIEQQRQVALGAKKAAEDDRQAAVIAEQKATEAAGVARKEKDAADAEREKVAKLNNQLSSTIGDLKTQTDLAKANEKKAKDNELKAKENEQQAQKSALEAKAEKEKAEKALKDLEKSQEAVRTEAKKAVYEAYVAKVGLYQTKIDQNFFRQGGEDFAQLLNLPGSEQEQPLRNWEWGRLRFLCSLSERTYREPKSSPFLALATLPDGKRFVTLSEHRQALLWDAEKSEPIAVLLNHDVPLRAAAVASDGRIFIGADDGSIHLCSVDQPKAVKWNVESAPKEDGGALPRVTALRLSPDEKKLVAGYSSGDALFWTMDGKIDGQPLSGTHVSDVGGHAVLDVAFTPDGRGVATVGEEGHLCFWRASDHQALYWQVAHDNRPATCVVVLARDKAVDVVTGGMDGFVRVWRSNPWVNVSSRPEFTKNAEFLAHERGVRDLTLGAEQLRLFTAGEDNVACEWSPPPTGSGPYLRQRMLRGHGSAVVSAVQPSKAAERVFTASADGSAKSWNLRTYSEQFELSVPAGAESPPEVTSVSNVQSPDGGRWATAAAGKLGAVAWPWSPAAKEWGTARLLSEGHSGQITWISVYEEGAVRLAATCCPAIGAKDYSIRLWDLAAKRELSACYGHSDSVNMVVFSPDGSRMLSGSSDGSAILWDVKTGEKVVSIPAPGRQAIHSVAFLPGGKVLLGGKGGVYEFAVTPKVEKTKEYLGDDFHGMGKEIVDLFVLSERKLLLSASKDNTAVLNELESGKRVGERMNPKAPIRRAALSDDRKRLVLADDNQAISFWNLETGAALPIRAPIGDLIQSVSTRDRDVVVCTKQGELRWFKLDDPKPVKSGPRPPLEPQGRFSSAVLLKDGKVLTAVFEPGQGSHLEIWPRDMNPQGAAQIGLHTQVVGAAAIPVDPKLPGPQRVATCSEEGVLKRWNAESGRVEQVYDRLQPFRGAASAFALNASGTMMAVGSVRGEVVLFDPVAGKVVKSYAVPANTLAPRINSLRFSADGHVLLIAAGDGRPRLWPLDAAEPAVLTSTKDDLLDLALSNDGGSLAAALQGGRAIVWTKDPAAKEGWRPKFELAGHSEAVRSVVFSPDGRRIVTGSIDGTVKVWDADLGPGREGAGAAFGQELISLRADQEFTAVQFSPDGLNILAATTDGMVIVWPALPWDRPRAAVAGGRPKPSATIPAGALRN